MAENENVDMKNGENAGETYEESPPAGEPAQAEERESEPVVDVHSPLEEEPFRPLVEEFAKAAGLGEDMKQAALILHKMLREAGLDPYMDLLPKLKVYKNIFGISRELKSLGKDAGQVGELIAARAATNLGNDALSIASEEVDTRHLLKLMDKMLLMMMFRYVAEGRQNQNDGLAEILKRQQELLEEMHQRLSVLEEQIRNFTPTPSQEQQGGNIAESMMKKFVDLAGSLLEEKIKGGSSELPDEVKAKLEAIEKELSELKDKGKIDLMDLLSNPDKYPFLANVFGGGNKMSLEEWIKFDKHLFRKKLLDKALKLEEQRLIQEQKEKAKRRHMVEKTLTDIVDSIGESIEEIERSSGEKQAQSPQIQTEEFKCEECGETIRVVAGKPQKVVCPKCKAEYEYVPAGASA